VGTGMARCGAPALALFAVLTALWGGSALAQNTLIAIRSNETIPLRIINWVNMHDCESQLVSVEGLDVLEGPGEIKLEFKPRKVLASSGTCAKEVDGGEIVAISQQIARKTEAQLVFRVRLATKSGPVMLTYSYRFLLFP
jgi:hypothetical protein